MGQSISSFIKSIDGGDASAQETKDTLNALYALGESRVDAAYALATSDRGNMYAPISKVILRRQQIVCKTSTDTSAIAQGIKDSVGKLMNGQILDGVVDLLQNGLNIVLGSSTGQISSTYTYALVATDIGGLLRIDIDVYNFALASQGLQTKVQNMTAISSLVSSVDPTKLTASDIRAIISVSYGGSPLDRQQAILDLVMTAWQMDKKQLDAGSGGLTERDLADFRAKVRPSRFDVDPPPPCGGPATRRSPRKVGRVGLQRAFASLQITGDAVDSPVKIWIKLSVPADDFFTDWLQGIMKALSVPNIFVFEAIDAAGFSGDALGLDCTVTATGLKQFESAIAYIEDTVLYSLKNSGIFSKWIDTIGLQYRHPGTNASGYMSRLSFQDNPITNTTQNLVQMFEPETFRMVLHLEAGQTATLTGTVLYLTSSKPAGPGGADATGPQKWVTYDEVAGTNILATMPVSLQSLPGGGCSLSLIGPNNQPWTIMYGDAWPL